MLGSRGGMLARIVDVQNRIFGVGKTSVIILIIQLVVLVAALVGVAGLRAHYTSHGLMLLKMRSVMQEIYDVDRNIR